MNNASKGRCVTITPSDRLREHYAFRLASAKRKSPARALGAPLDTFPDSTGMAERRSPIRRVSGHFCETRRVGDRRSGGKCHAHRVGARKKVCPQLFFQTQSLMIMSKVSTAPHPPPAEPVSAARTAPDFSQPVQRPPKGALKLMGEVLNHGGPGYLQFAITNLCNADCDFCGFARSKFDPQARRSVSLDEARRVIDIAVKNHIGYLLFVGGEPMVHRDLRAMTRHAAETRHPPDDLHQRRFVDRRKHARPHQ